MSDRVGKPRQEGSGARRPPEVAGPAVQ